MNDNTSDDIQSVQGMTPDFKTEFAKQLSELAPELVADGKIDSKKLKELLDGDEADDSERFGLFWPGKKRAMRAAQEPSTATLKPIKEESKDWDTTQNLFIEGDNLEVLKVLQKHYHNKIKMIYIDPPYNTGKDFVYPDNFVEGLQNYLEFSKQVDEGNKKISTNTETDGRYHSNWLNMMYPRIKLARNLLTDDGVIFISIDDSEQANLKKSCDEVFGENNFVGSFIWKKKGTSTNVTGAQLSALTEYILCYARSSSSLPLNPRVVSSSERSYPFEDAEGSYRTAGLEKKSTGDYNRESMKFDIIGHTPRPGKRWQIGIDKARELESKNRFIFDNGIVKLKIYDFEDSDSYSANPNLLLDMGSTQSGQIEVDALMGGSLFDTPKPVSLISHLMNMGTKKDSIILDFFSGSGTTAHATMQLNAYDGGNRRHIQVQLPEPTDEKSDAYKAGFKTISDIAKERIRRAGGKIRVDFTGKMTERELLLDTGFRVYKLAESNFTKWQSASDTDKDSLQQHLLNIRESSNDAATEEDLLTEVLLKQGISLTAPIAHSDIEGLSVWTVGDDLVCAYLNESQKPTLDQLRAVAAKEPAKLIILEDAFKGDDELKTNLVQICKSQKIELWTV